MSRTVGRICGALVLGATLAAVSSVRAAGGTAREPRRHEARWDPAWSHSSPWDYTVAGLSAGVFAFEGIVLQPSQAPLRWDGPILFDADVRSALRLGDLDDGGVPDAISWALWGAQLALPVAVDVPYAWARYGYGLARDLFWQDAATLFFAGAFDLALRDIVGRARPRVYDCIRNGGTNCIDGPEAVRSFPGGHFLNSTAASVLTCTQHLYVHLYGRPWDELTCAMTLASDVTVGVLRIVTDSHWVTDEIAGAMLGALIGWGVPYIMHFRNRSRSDPDAARPTSMILPMPVVLDHGGGVGVAGLF